MWEWLAQGAAGTGTLAMEAQQLPTPGGTDTLATEAQQLPTAALQLPTAC